MKTYRYRGHSMSDPAKYRTREEVTEMREKRDPIDHFGKKLVQRGVVNENDLKEMDSQIKAVVVAAAEFATESPEPGVAELYTDIYA
jgi:pyruvate dehydrogenase E1 component alpha subunit